MRAKSNGVRSMAALGWMEVPLAQKKRRKPRNKANWMANLIRFEMTIESGTVSRGK
jgi:hypothetical protein